jgi:hypothetical protein
MATDTTVTPEKKLTGAALIGPDTPEARAKVAAAAAGVPGDVRIVPGRPVTPVYHREGA